MAYTHILPTAANASILFMSILFALSARTVCLTLMCWYVSNAYVLLFADRLALSAACSVHDTFSFWLN